MAPSQRRRSIDSSSSSSEHFPNAHDQSQSKNHYTIGTLKGDGGRNVGSSQQQSSAGALPRGHHEPPPPSYSPPTTSASTVQPGSPTQVPPSGYRIPLGTSGPLSPSPFPGIEKTREAPFTDADGKSPVFIGSALMQDSVHPCKIVPTHPQACYISYGGREIVHEGRYDLLLFAPEFMEFIPTSRGHVPHGRQPVKGGFENNGAELYHAVAVIDGVKVPGKTGTHLGGCNIPYGGREHVVRDKYEILCWRF